MPSASVGWPATIAAAFVAAQLLLVSPRMGLGWDEVVYVSQVSSHGPASYFSAPRARGVSVLVAPVASWTSSTVVLRVYLALLSGLGLHLALRVWRGVRPPKVLALAGLVFCGLWITLFYGPQAMPNLWVALLGLAAVGCFVRATAELTDRRALFGLAGCSAGMALLRPTDAVWLVLPLLAVSALSLLRRRPRRPLPFAALVAGLVVGAADWVIEAYTSYGGLTARLDAASAAQGGLGWNITIGDVLRSLSGRILCRPCDVPWPNPVVTVWWFVLPLLALGGLALAARPPVRIPVGTPLLLACAGASAVQYLFLIGYTAPRFLLPAYALLALPAAECLARLVAAARPRWRPLVQAVVALGLAGHLAVQYLVLDRVVSRNTAAHEDWSRVAGGLHRLGIRPPCLLTGEDSLPTGFYASCASASISGNNADITPEGIRTAARHRAVGVLAPPGGGPPRYARAWTWRTLPAPAPPGRRVYLPPSPPPP